MALSTPVLTTGNPLIDGLLGGVRWTSPALTTSFPATAGLYENPYNDGSNEPLKGFQPLTNNASMVNGTRYAYAQYAAVSGLTFTEITETATSRAIMRNAYSTYASPTEGGNLLAWAYFPTEGAQGGDAWYNNGNATDNVDARMGNNDWSTIMHEIGHGLGLKHPHDQDDGSPFPRLPAAYDSGDYTVMSYRAFAGAPLSGGENETFGFSQTLMSLDIAAIQVMYGANYATNAGDTTYAFSAATGEMFVNGVGQGAPGANRVFRTVWDGGGTDTYDLSNYNGGITADLRPGGWMTFSPDQLARLKADGSVLAAGNVSNALLYNGNAASLIENLFAGAGNDTITGNDANNTLYGGGGLDTILGGGGDDRLFGGEGIDTLYAGDGNDYLSADAGESSVLAGEAGSDTIYGGEGNDYCVGGAGDDVMVGLGGVDSLYGGDGNDYIVAGDGVGCVVDGGAGANSLWGAGGNDYFVGGEGNDILVSGAGNDYVFGNAGDDAVYAGGGTDYIYGNAGNDFIYTDDFGASATDYVYAGGGTGVDSVVDFTAGAGPNADVLVISPASGIGSFAQAQAAMSQVGVYTVLTMSGGDAVYLYNVSTTQMTANNFLFI